MHYRHAVAALCTVLLGACANVIPNHIALPEAAKTQFASTEVIAAIPQSEIYVFVPNSNVSAATGGGLLGALIDAGVNSARTGNAEDAVKPLRNALVGYDFDQTVANELKTALSAQTFLNVSGVKVSKEAYMNLGKAVETSTASAVLMTWVDYQLDNDGVTLTVTLTANLYPKTDALVKLRPMKPEKYPLAAQNAIYRTILLNNTTLPAPGAKADRDAYIAAWSANGGAPMRDALNKAAADLAQKLAADIPLPPAPVAKGK